MENYVIYHFAYHTKMYCCNIRSRMIFSSTKDKIKYSEKEADETIAELDEEYQGMKFFKEEL